ncbi:unnamed protein product, partial [Polarella glacialis]
CGWGTLMRRLKERGVLDQGFSEQIGEAMMASCCALMNEFGAVLGQTHSDELTVLVPPTKGARAHGGSMQKWISTAASVATNVFNRRIAAVAAERNMVLDKVIVAHFDCRVGVFETAAEAQALILWRASDCAVNAPSDAIKWSDAAMKVREFNTIEKLAYLQSHELLPLRRHHGYGSLFAE